MIFGNVNNMEEFPFLEEQIKECFEYAKTHDLASFEKGSHEIDGERLFVNIVEYTTTNAEDRFWEAHKKYLDVHVMIHGNEQIDLNFIQNMDVKEFVEADDFLKQIAVKKKGGEADAEKEHGNHFFVVGK